MVFGVLFNFNLFYFLTNLFIYKNFGGKTVTAMKMARSLRAHYAEIRKDQWNIS